ncbi:Protein transport protein SEC1 [Candida viswanathii]|uniref:Protein transport protein SEC1 n=1 Tax=Candida viswanathii TaxID=5486 RepID=A0A367YIA9_9ASCO|nr:Protein transport protein SEC1 [Candida viswanathii]
MDLYAPLLHEFTYQAMAYDIVETRLENENDEDWVNLRHLHIIESSELIFNKISDLIKNNPLMVDRSKATTSSDLMHIVAHLKGFDEERAQLKLHKSLIDECLDINASRVSFEGERNKHLHDDLIILLARDDLHINDKMRLVLIYAFYRGGLIRQDFEKMIRFIGVNDKYITGLVEKCFNNVEKLGFQVFKQNVKDKPFHKEMYHVINNEGTYNTSRYTPGIKRIMQNAGKYSLDREWFPYFRDQPLDEDLPTNNSRMSSSSNGKELQSSGSLRNPRIKAAWASSSARNTMTLATAAKSKQRIFCYVAEELDKPTDPPLHVFQDGIPKPNVKPASQFGQSQNQFSQQVQQQQQMYQNVHQDNGNLNGGIWSGDILTSLVLNAAATLVALGVHYLEQFKSTVPMECCCLLVVPNNLELGQNWKPYLRNKIGSDFSTLVILSLSMRSPYDRANVFSRITFDWMGGLMKKGYHKYLTEEDLPPLPKDLRASKTTSDFDHYWNSQPAQKKSIPWAVAQAFGAHFLMGGLFKGPRTHWLSLTSVVYNKSLVLSNEARQESSTGDIVNLMSVDVQRLQDLVQNLQIIWSGPFQIILCLYSLHTLLGNAMWAGVAIMVIMIPLNAVIAKTQRRLQKTQMKYKDERSRLINEILNNIKSLNCTAGSNHS